MLLRLNILLLCGAALSAQSTPVLVELFTSEGCSSCPPADVILSMLEKQQPVAGVRIIAMSEHVDYWNRLGWKDPFSSKEMTSRQEIYADRFRSQGAYTPQMIVDGAEEFVGNDGKHATRSIAASAARAKIPITAQAVEAGMYRVTSPSGAMSDVFVAVVYDPAPSDVARGENSGRRLVHVSVVKSLKRIGEISPAKGYDERIPIAADGKLPNERVIAFLQERGQGRVLGAAEVSVRQSAGIVAR